MSTSKADLLERIAHLSDEKRALLEARLAEAGKEKSTGIPKCQPMDSYPLSFAQESLWFLSQLESDSPFYNEACAVEFNGNVDHDALNWSINQIVQRHGILRTTITVTNEGQPRQVVLQNSTLTVKHINLQEWPKHVHTVQKLIEAETKQPFDLAAAPPFKVTLIQICSNKYILLLVLHHIVADRWSSRLLIQEFSVLYGAYFNDQKSPLPELSIQYADYAVWQREKLKDLLYDKHIEFWKKQLTSALPVLGLPVDLPRPPILKHQGRKYHFELPQELTIALRQFCQFNSTTLFTTLIAVFTTLLYRYTKQNDICIGFPVTNRTRIELQSLIGFFVNTLILRTDLSDSPSFTALLVRIKHTIHAAHAHQDIPFGTILDTLNPVRDTSYTPLFQTMFVFQSKTVSELDLPGIKSRLFELDSGGTKFDVTLCVSEEEGVLKAWFEYNTELFFEQTMVRWARHYQQLLEVAITRPGIPIDVLNYLSHEERQQLLLDWNATEVLYTQDRCIHQLFEEQVEKNPDAVAVIFGERQLTYGQLNAKANQLAHYLRAQEVGPEVLVGICVERSLEMVAGILAILKAGGAYVPIDPKAPQERIADVLSNARPALVLTQEKLREQLPSAIQLFNLDSEWSQIAQERTDPVTSAVTPDNLAYVLHTSGSTGKPKGVAVTHRNVVNSTQARLDYYQQPIDSFLLLSSVIFDSSIVGLFGTLSQGGRLVFPQDDALLDVSYLTRLITDYKVSHLLAVPSLYKAILRQIATGHADTSLEAVLIAGETCYPDLVKLHDQLLPQTELFNEYGPTEATVWSSVHQIQQEAIQHTVSIGRPIANTQIYLLDAYQNPVPVGVPGELYIGGIGLARGYLNRSNLTAERFIPNPFSKQLGERLYRTGDLARYRADGNIEYLGRTDHQVKIRGFRIELGEIEAALLQHEQIKEAVAIVREDNPGDKRLVAYVVDHASTLDIETIRSYLKTHLPDYMIPAAFVFLDNLPLNSNGKLDRKALPIPDISHQLIHEYVAPRNLAEEILANIWAEVLGVEKVGIYDNFFELGGDSILSIQMTSRARQAGIVLTPKEFFQYQTIGKLAANINNVGETKQQIAEQGLITGSVPLVPIQHWFFEQKLPNSYHWNQSIVLEAKEAIDADIFEKIVEKLEQHHDVLRSRFFQKDGQWYQNYVAEKSKGVFQEVDLSNISNDKQQEVIEAQATEWQSSLDLLEGPIWRIVWLNFGRHRAGRLLIIIHHLVIDGVSWRILLEDLQTCYQWALNKEKAIDLPPKTTSFKRWSESLSDYVTNGMLNSQIDYWQHIAGAKVIPLLVDNPSGSNIEAFADETIVFLNKTQTDALLRIVPAAYHTQINDILLTALLQTFCDWAHVDSILINLEGHGREDNLFGNIDVSRTVGWFTSSFPALLIQPHSVTPRSLIKSVKEKLRNIPDKGLGYGLLRYLGQTEIVEQIVMSSQPQINFNYLGQFDQTLAENSLFFLAKESIGSERDGKGTRCYELDINACIIGNCLRVGWTYGTARYHKKTIEKLALAYISNLQGLIHHCATLEKEEFTPSDFPLARLKQADLDNILRKQPDIEDIYPLAPLQQGLIFHSLYAPETGMYCNQFSCTLTNGLNVEIFIQAWRHLVARHPALRTAFLIEKRELPLQLVFSKIEIPVEYLDWRKLSADDQVSHWQNYLILDRNKAFSFDQAPLMRFALIQCAQNRYYFLWTHHHVLLDGWCTPLIFKEVFNIYEALLNGHDIAPASNRLYRDYIAWLLKQDRYSAENYWKRTLSGFSTCTSLGVADHIISNTVSQDDFSTYSFAITTSHTSHLTDYTKYHQLTLNTLIQGAWALLLSHYSGDQDVVFGITVSGRPADLAGVDQMIGLFINTVPLRVKIQPEVSTISWLRTLFQKNQDIRQYEYVPLVDIQKRSDIPRGQPLFESLLVFENYPVDWAIESYAETIGIQDITFKEQTNYPLVVTAMCLPGEGLTLCFNYKNNLFTQSTIVRMGGHFQRLLEGIVSSPDKCLADLPLLPDVERNQLLGWNATGVVYSGEECLHQLFEAQVEKNPDAIAVVFEDQQLTYGQLNAKVNRLAHYLRAQGVGPEVLVGICVERSLKMVIGILSILKAGGAYMPIDPDYPRERIAFMLGDARPVLSLIHTATREVLPEGISVVDMDEQWQAIAQFSEDNPPNLSQVQNLAYVIYTSGSTGRPKGTLVTHLNALRLFSNTQNEFTFSDKDVWTLFHSSAFDFSVWELWGALIFGGKLVVVPYWVSRSPEEFYRLLCEQAVTVLNLIPSAFRSLIHEAVLAHNGGKQRHALRLIIFGGEALELQHLKSWFDHFGYDQPQLVNMYGITETTVHVTRYPIYQDSLQKMSGSPIGRPIEDLQAYILDRYFNLQPIGVPGGLYIGGAGLARGYLDRPDLTAERFIPNPFSGQPGERLYRTGDLARYRVDGNIEYLGRTDHQVKIRGFRIELGEIEAALLGHEGIKEAIVIVREDNPEDKRLVAYIIGNESAPDIEAIRTHLRTSLPDYMVPSAFVFLDHFPLTPNGKLDRKALPAPDVSEQLTYEYVAPRNPTEAILADIWAEVLGIEKVGIYDNFFELGGDSLLVMQIILRVSAQFKTKIPVRAMFKEGTVEALAKTVEAVYWLAKQNKEDIRNKKDYEEFEL